MASHANIHAYMRARTHTWEHSHANTQIHTHICTHTHASPARPPRVAVRYRQEKGINTHIYQYVHTCIHIYMHIYTCKFRFELRAPIYK